MRVKHKKYVIWTLFLFSHFWLNSLSLSSRAAAVSWKVSKFLFCFSSECHFSVIPQDVLPLVFLWCLKNIRTTTIRANTTTPRQVPMYTSFPGTIGHHVSRACLSIRYQHHLKKKKKMKYITTKKCRCSVLEGGTVSSFASSVKDSGRSTGRALCCESRSKKND